MKNQQDITLDARVDDCVARGISLAVRLPSVEEYRRLRDDPNIEHCFDEDGWPLGGAIRQKPANFHENKPKKTSP